MREYLLYSILTFLPVGCIMSLFLRREGLGKKHIITFVTLALIMVIIFPITAERLGIFNTGSIYALLMLTISWYFIKTHQLDYLCKPSVNKNINESMVEFTAPITLKEALAVEELALCKAPATEGTNGVEPVVNQENRLTDPSAFDTDESHHIKEAFSETDSITKSGVITEAVKVMTLAAESETPPVKDDFIPENPLKDDNRDQPVIAMEHDDGSEYLKLEPVVEEDNASSESNELVLGGSTNEGEIISKDSQIGEPVTELAAETLQPEDIAAENGVELMEGPDAVNTEISTDEAEPEDDEKEPQAGENDREDAQIAEPVTELAAETLPPEDIVAENGVELMEGPDAVNTEISTDEAEPEDDEKEPQAGENDGEDAQIAEPVAELAAELLQPEDIAAENGVNLVEGPDAVNTEISTDEAEPEDDEKEPQAGENDREDAQIAEPVTELAAQTLPPEDIAAENGVDLVEGPYAVINETGSDEAVPDDGQEQRVKDFIEKAFAVKGADLEQAAQYFQMALDTTKNDELTYLLTMELMEDYKDIGMYDKAIQVLSDFAREKSEVNNQITNNIIYFRTLVNELEKIGTPDLPFPQVPRWVRMKVAEKIKLLDN
ncbi:MAG: hypothetical protein ACOX6I_09795 [Syntrophomonadaceae bacterium]|jgi:phenylpyruvate tautomerase PptA (4-oxalocrotonate tautomerase family)